MNYSKLTKAYPVRLTLDQDKALNILNSKGFKKSQFIRIAIEDKLKNEFRKILKESKPKETCPF
jgi:predicted DNA-binding protein